MSLIWQLYWFNPQDPESRPWPSPFEVAFCIRGRSQNAALTGAEK